MSVGNEIRSLRAVRFRQFDTHRSTPRPAEWSSSDAIIAGCRTGAATRGTGGVEDAEPMEIPHVFRFSTISDDLGVSTLRPRTACASPSGPERGLLRRSGVCETPRARRIRSGFRRKLRAYEISCASGAAWRCEPARALPVFWRLRQFSCTARPLRARALRRILPDAATRKRPSHYWTDQRASRSITSSPGGISNRNTESSGPRFARTSLNSTTVTLPSRS